MQFSKRLASDRLSPYTKIISADVLTNVSQYL